MTNFALWDPAERETKALSYEILGDIKVRNMDLDLNNSIPIMQWRRPNERMYERPCYIYFLKSKSAKFRKPLRRRTGKWVLSKRSAIDFNFRWVT